MYQSEKGMAFALVIVLSHSNLSSNICAAQGTYISL